MPLRRGCLGVTGTNELTTDGGDVTDLQREYQRLRLEDGLSHNRALQALEQWLGVDRATVRKYLDNADKADERDRKRAQARAASAERVERRELEAQRAQAA